MRKVIAALKIYTNKFFTFVKTYPRAIFINAIMATVIVTISALSISRFMPIGPDLNDFATYYYSAKILVQNPSHLYDSEWARLTYNIFPFRYFPTMLILFFLPFTALPLTVGYILFSFILFIINIVNIILVWEIIHKVIRQANQTFLILCTITYFVLAFHIDVFLQAQVSSLVALMLLLSLYFYLENRENLGGIFLGLSLIIKPITFLQIFFILLAALPALTAKNVKNMVKRVLWILIPLLPDILWFSLVPGYLEGFIRVNFVDTARTSAYWSVSFSNFFVSILGTSFNGTFILCLVATLTIGIYFMRKIKEDHDRILFSFIYGMIAYFITQIDIWALQLPTLYPFLILGAAFIINRKIQRQFYILYLLYPCAAEFLSLMVFGKNLIIPIIPVVSFALLLLAAITIWAFYQQARQNRDAIEEKF